MAADQRPTFSVQAVSGRLLDEDTGQWSADSVFDPSFVPFNQMGTSFLLMVTLDSGVTCVLLKPSGEEARAIARGERSPPTRPAACDKPRGWLNVDVRHGDGLHDRRAVELSRFFPRADGKILVPVLFYRRLPCQPLDFVIATSEQKQPMVRRVEFRCAE